MILEKDMKIKEKEIILTLSLITILFIGIFAYIFIAKPFFDDYIKKKQLEAQNVIFSALFSQLAELGYIEIAIENETLVLVPSGKTLKKTTTDY
jgi:tellurite resistance protein TehA-like permease